jgi:hypothetical protein
LPPSNVRTGFVIRHITLFLTDDALECNQLCKQDESCIYPAETLVLAKIKGWLKISGGVIIIPQVEQEVCERSV